MRATARIGRLRQHGLAILAEHLDRRCGHRIARIDGLHKHVLAVVDRALDQDSQIGHDDQPLVGRAGGPLRRRIVAVRPQQEHASAPAVRFQIAGQIERLVLWLARRLLGQFDHLAEAFGDVAFVEIGRKLGFGKTPAWSLRDQMLDLLRQQAADFEAHALNVARQHRQLLFTRERQQRALRHDPQFTWERRHLDDEIEIAAELIAAERLESLGDFDINVASGLGLVLEAVQFGVFALGGHRLQLEHVAALENIGADARLVAFPIVALLAIVGLGRRIIERQHPRAHAFCHLLLVDQRRDLGDQQLFGLETFVVDQRRLHRVHGKAVEPWNGHRTRDLGGRRRSAARGARPRIDQQIECRRLRGNGERLRVDESVELPFVVADLERRGLPTQAEDAFALPCEAQRDPLFEFGRVDRMAEIDGGDDLFRCGINRVLIELRFGQLGQERRGLEMNSVVRQTHWFGQGDAAFQRYRELSAHRPLGLGIEPQHLVAIPLPFAFQLWVERDPGAHFLARILQRRDGSREFDHQRLRLGVSVLESNRTRFGDFVRDQHRLGLRLPPLPSSVAAGGDGGDHRQPQRRCARASPQPSACCPEFLRHKLQPARRVPSPATEDGLQNKGERPPERVADCLDSRTESDAACCHYSSRKCIDRDPTGAKCTRANTSAAGYRPHHHWSQA